MIVAVFEPPPRIDATNVAEFAKTVSRYLAGHGSMVINCSAVVWIASSGMRVLELASHDAPITLVNPSPAVHLMAATFAGDVRLRHDPPAIIPRAHRQRGTAPANVTVLAIWDTPDLEVLGGLSSRRVARRATRSMKRYRPARLAPERASPNDDLA
jgi:hypothetical protein